MHQSFAELWDLNQEFSANTQSDRDSGQKKVCSQIHSTTLTKSSSTICSGAQETNEHGRTKVTDQDHAQHHSRSSTMDILHIVTVADDV